MVKVWMLVIAFVLMLPGFVIANEHGSAQKWMPDMVSVLPFGLLLLCIAVLPLHHVTGHWWEHNWVRAVVSGMLSLPILWAVLSNESHLLEHAGLEYFQFLTLIAALFVVAGGLHITGDLRAKPAMNTLIIAVGYVLASFIGTTGASMVLIYPLLRANSERKHVAHTVIFFIFAVSNCGGLLTPIGDPPLFIGYLRGIEFTWFAENLWWIWLVVGVYLHVVYFFIDAFFLYPKETQRDIQRDIEAATPLGMIGLFNLPLLVVIVGAVAKVPTPWREIVLWGCAITSLVYSHRTEIGARARALNKFSFSPILEVAILFAGIFITMIPALRILEVRGAELGVTTPVQYFWATGVFSSFLDNAPTFLVFLTLAMSTAGLDANNPEHVRQFMNASTHILAGISVGAVCMGASTYIGNAPNFMVKSVAENQDVKMPSFFGYMLWSGLILMPLFIVIGLLIRFV